MSKSSLVLRAAVGGIMLGHDLQKLKGAFDGPGLEGTEKMVEGLGLYPPKVQARLVALTETVGGGLTAAGLLSPLGPAMIMGTMGVAIYKVHLKNGFWNHKGGFEFNTLMAASCFALASSGPGALSMDGILRKQRSGPHWGIIAAGLALGAAAATVKMGESMAPSSTSPEVASTRDLSLDGQTATDSADDTVDISVRGTLDEPVYQHQS